MRAPHSDAASERGDDRMRDVEAQPEAPDLVARDGPLEALEDEGLALGWNADAVIGDDQTRAVCLALDIDLNRSALAELDGVRQEVRDHLVEAGSIPATHGGPAGADR